MYNKHYNAKKFIFDIYTLLSSRKNLYNLSDKTLELIKTYEEKSEKENLKSLYSIMNEMMSIKTEFEIAHDNVALNFDEATVMLFKEFEDLDEFNKKRFNKKIEFIYSNEHVIFDDDFISLYSDLIYDFGELDQIILTDKNEKIIDINMYPEISETKKSKIFIKNNLENFIAYLDDYAFEETNEKILDYTEDIYLEFKSKEPDFDL